jgi:hypothetical protein
MLSGALRDSFRYRCGWNGRGREQRFAECARGKKLGRLFLNLGVRVRFPVPPSILSLSRIGQSLYYF